MHFSETLHRLSGLFCEKCVCDFGSTVPIMFRVMQEKGTVISTMTQESKVRFLAIYIFPDIRLHL